MSDNMDDRLDRLERLLAKAENASAGPEAGVTQPKAVSLRWDLADLVDLSLDLPSGGCYVYQPCYLDSDGKLHVKSNSSDAHGFTRFKGMWRTQRKRGTTVQSGDGKKAMCQVVSRRTGKDGKSDLVQLGVSLLATLAKGRDYKAHWDVITASLAGANDFLSEEKVVALYGITTESVTAGKGTRKAPCAPKKPTKADWVAATEAATEIAEALGVPVKAKSQGNGRKATKTAIRF